jgi:outer membrane protease
MKLYYKIMPILVLACSCNTKKKDELQSTVYPVENGYGYKIIHNNKVFINQAYIPSIEGNKVFCDSIDAAKTANFVKELIENRKSPTITKADLTALNIKTKC